jgi:acylphosphatase
MVALCRKGPPASRVDAVLDTPAAGDQLKLRWPGEEFSVISTV